MTRERNSSEKHARRMRKLRTGKTDKAFALFTIHADRESSEMSFPMYYGPEILIRVPNSYQLLRLPVSHLEVTSQ